MVSRSELPGAGPYTALLGNAPLGYCSTAFTCKVTSLPLERVITTGSPARSSRSRKNTLGPLVDMSSQHRRPRVARHGALAVVPDLDEVDGRPHRIGGTVFPFGAHPDGNGATMLIECAAVSSWLLPGRLP